VNTIKVMIEPSTDALVEELLPYLWEVDPAVPRDIITEIRSLGYQICRQVDVPLAVIEAIESSIAHPERNVRRGRPTRGEENGE